MINVNSASYEIVSLDYTDGFKGKAKLSFECVGDVIEVERLITVILDLTVVS